MNIVLQIFGALCINLLVRIILCKGNFNYYFGGFVYVSRKYNR
nr:MAG TPA: hypothetical protein [Caudoviricetes sp.]